MTYCYYQGKPTVVPLHACYWYCYILQGCLTHTTYIPHSDSKLTEESFTGIFYGPIFIFYIARVSFCLSSFLLSSFLLPFVGVVLWPCLVSFCLVFGLCLACLIFLFSFFVFSLVQSCLVFVLVLSSCRRKRRRELFLSSRAPRATFLFFDHGRCPAA
jgi:hypothetical protein